MRSIRTWGCTAIAAFALGGLAAEGAAALPEVGRCVSRAGTGKYSDSNCHFKGLHGSYEWEHNPLLRHFTASGNEAVIEDASGLKIVCWSNSSSGEYLSTTTTREVKNVIMVLTRCTIPNVDIACNSAGAQEGEIVSNRLKGKLAYISGKGTNAPVVGQLLAPESKRAAFREWTCGGGLATGEEEQGSGGGHATVIATIAPLNTMSTVFEEEYKGANGVQQPQHVEGSTLIDNLEVSREEGPFELADQVFATTITNEEALEIKA
jgi:hypothetical protein